MTLLELRDISKSFGGLQVLDRITIKVEEGDFCAMIGPNGAGKTTLFNVITKYIKPDSGQIIFGGNDITKLKTREICRIGIGRSFQLPTIYPGLTILENLQLAFLAKAGKSSNFFSPAANMFREEAEEVIRTIGISARPDSMAGVIPHGDKRRLDVAMVLALQPRLLLLDEPTSGLAPKERFEMVELLLKLASERGLTVLLVEHELDVAFTAHTILVLHYGRVIAEGKPEEIKCNEEVQRIYLRG